MENEKLITLKKVTEELIQNSITLIGTLIQQYEAAVIGAYKKTHPELLSATLIRYNVVGGRLPTVILTIDDDEIRRFQNIRESFSHPKKKVYIDLRINEIQFSKVNKTSTILTKK